MESNLILKGIPVSQNKQEFIIGKVTIQELFRFTKFTERVIIGYDEEELPIYNKHIQRKVESARVNKIADFLIFDKEATFPTNIVLGVPLQAIYEQKRNGDLIEIQLIEEVFEQVSKSKDGNDGDIYVTIIDGQHRIRGIEIAINTLENEISELKNSSTQSESIIKSIDLKQNRLNDLLNIELVVSYFIDKSLEYQAMIFSTINRTQKRVSQDLVYSLFGLSSDDTPYKTALEVTLALNSHKKSPFYRRIKLYGGNYRKGESPPLSQSTMIKNIVALISETLRESENDKYLKRKDLLKRKNNKFLPFREFYANNQDSLISDCLFYYFNTVRKSFTVNGVSLWDYDGVSKPENILQSTVGFEALLKILVDILKVDSINSFNSEVFEKYFSNVNNTDFRDTNIFSMSTRGKNIFYLTMSLHLFPAPTNLSEKDSRRENLQKLINEIQ
ncbi:MAG: DGQHR domain-containing protein [Crenarchaeota archaeon]|nr:DGQHR domain-containing protein [Thermoproteota archaeon]